MNLSDYILLPREERLAHVDLSSECVLIPRTGRWTKFKVELLNFLSIDDDVPLWRGRVHRCHACDNDTQKKMVCVNPLHLYIGTPRENLFDRPPELAAAGGLAVRGMKRDEKFCRQNREKRHRMVDVSRESTGEFMRARSQKLAAFIIGVSPSLVSSCLKTGRPTRDLLVFSRPVDKLAQGLYPWPH